MSDAGPRPLTGRRVVVGIDDSPSSRAALRHALQEARERGTRLDVTVAVARAGMRSRVFAAARAVVDEILAADAVERSAAAPDVRVLVEVGRPGSSLVTAAQGADLLVVGHRGRGASGSAVIGSVAWWCLGHATCPVTVVPSPGAPRRPWPRERQVDEAP